MNGPFDLIWSSTDYLEIIKIFAITFFFQTTPHTTTTEERRATSGMRIVRLHRAAGVRDAEVSTERHCPHHIHSLRPQIGLDQTLTVAHMNR